MTQTTPGISFCSRCVYRFSPARCIVFNWVGGNEKIIPFIKDQTGISRHRSTRDFRQAACVSDCKQYGQMFEYFFKAAAALELQQRKDKMK